MRVKETVWAYRRISGSEKSAADLSPAGSRFSATSWGDHTHEAELKLSPTGSGLFHTDASTRRHADTSSPASRIQSITQTIAEEIQSQERERHGQGGKNEEPPITLNRIDDLGGVAEQQPPTGERRLYPYAEKAEK